MAFELNKELCIKCHDTHRFLPWSMQPAKNRNWDDRGRVACICLFNNGVKYYPTNKPPPLNCFFHLEQIMTGTK